MSDPSRFIGLPAAEFGSPGPSRDTLVAAILDGSKTTTANLLAEYESTNDPLPWTGARWAVIDSDERPVAVIEITAVEVRPLCEVDMGHVSGEGEGHRSVADWRHERTETWSRHGPVDDETAVVLETFRLTD